MIGAAMGIAAMIDARRWLGGLALQEALAIGMIAAVLGPMGDLCKSKVKRAAA